MNPELILKLQKIFSEITQEAEQITSNSNTIEEKIDTINSLENKEKLNQSFPESEKIKKTVI